MDHGPIPKTVTRAVVVISGDDVWKLPSYSLQVDTEGVSGEGERIGQFKFRLKSMDVKGKFKGPY